MVHRFELKRVERKVVEIGKRRLDRRFGYMSLNHAQLYYFRTWFGKGRAEVLLGWRILVTMAGLLREIIMGLRKKLTLLLDRYTITDYRENILSPQSLEAQHRRRRHPYHGQRLG